MENVDVNQLPEVDSLPDGFVDSSAEPQAPLTPDLEQEKHHCNRKEDAEMSEHNSVGETISLGMSNEDYENSEKLRMNPALSSVMDEVGASAHLEETPDRSSSKDVEDTISNSSSSNTVSEASVGVSICSDAKEQVEGSSPSLKKFIHGSSDAQTTHVEEISSSGSTELQKGKKQETTETKRKNAKRTFKSEKEFLEFTLSYQKVLSERDAAIAVRDKLESLCRELQRQNKTLMEECKRVSSEGQSLRLDLSTKFHDAIKDVSNKLEEQKEESLSQLKENEMLRNKLKQLIDQYALSEQQSAQKLKQKTLELQLADLKIQQHQEKLVQEQSQMKIYAEQVTQLLATEKHLRQQLTADGEKFQQFQEALLKSNEVFETFKQEIEKMAKSIKELKKENSFLKSKCEKSDVTLIELVEEREKLKKQLEKTKNQKEKLEALCRSLQAERKQNSGGSNSSDAVPV